MKSRRLVGYAVAFALFVPGIAVADVFFKNADSKAVELTVKRSNTSMPMSIPGKATQALPGAPMTITLEKSGESIEALEGDTIVHSKGKLSKAEPEPDEEY